MSSAFRSVVLAAAARPAVRRLVAEHAAGRQLARRFVAGETLDDGLRAARELNDRGFSVSLDHLGEHTTSVGEARAAAAAYAELLERIHETRLDANVSLKLTQLGLELGDELCAANLERVVAAARARHNFVRIDMEESAFTERTLALFRRVYRRHPDHVGPVIQAYLYRSERDVRDLVRLGARVRLCKGAYAEPAAVAYPAKADVDRSFVRLMELLLLLGHYPAVATHDAAIIAHARRFADEWGVSKGQFEFQMLYGVRRDLQAALLGAGYRVRIYVPYGVAWYPYLSRRLAERPANALFVLRNLVREALARPA